MHDTAHEHARLFFELYWQPDFAVVAELGSYDVNGRLRDHAPAGTRYIGFDMAPGPGVDVVVAPGAALPLADASVDVAVTSSCFEHDVAFWDSFLELVRILRPGGLLYLNAPSNYRCPPLPAGLLALLPGCRPGAVPMGGAARRGGGVGRELHRPAGRRGLVRLRGGLPQGGTRRPSRRGRIAERAPAVNILDGGAGCPPVRQAERAETDEMLAITSLRAGLTQRDQAVEAAAARLAAQEAALGLPGGGAARAGCRDRRWPSPMARHGRRRTPTWWPASRRATRRSPPARTGWPGAMARSPGSAPASPRPRRRSRRCRPRRRPALRRCEPRRRPAPRRRRPPRGISAPCSAAAPALHRPVARHARTACSGADRAGARPIRCWPNRCCRPRQYLGAGGAARPGPRPALATAAGGLPSRRGARYPRAEELKDATAMLKAGIVGMGRWGRVLVESVQRKNDASLPGASASSPAAPARRPRRATGRPSKASACMTASRRCWPTPK